MSSLSLAEKSPYLEIKAPEQLVSTTNQSHLAKKNWLQCVSNRGIWSTSITNSAFLLAFVTTPIDSAHSMHASLVLSAHAHNYGLVMVVNNANGTRLAGSYSQTRLQSPIESECKIPIST